jgi:surface antigen
MILKQTLKTALCVSAVTAFAIAIAPSAGVAQGGPKEEQGSLLGSILGNVIGNIVPGGNSIAGQVLRSQAGNIGSLIGSSIGAQLDAEDQAKLAAATRGAISSGSARSFANPKTGVRGSVKVTSAPNDSNGRQCRTAQQEIKLKDGRTLTDQISACKGANGKWDV